MGGRIMPSLRPHLRRAVTLIAITLLSACTASATWHDTDITGAVPALALTMTRASDGQTVTGADYRGKVTLLYFGYTQCPDVCPMTLSNAALVLRALGPAANDVRVLFVTVDPNRDTLPVLKQYAAAFAPQIVGLRGDPNQLAALARRFRVAYSVDPKGPDGYTVSHSSAIYAFDGMGKARLLISSLSTTTPDIAGVTSDLRRLIG
jgi:protein SCO1/2